MTAPSVLGNSYFKFFPSIKGFICRPNYFNDGWRVGQSSGFSTEPRYSYFPLLGGHLLLTYS